MKTKKTRWNEYKKNIKKLGRMTIDIGAVGENEGGILNSDLLKIHEFTPVQGDEPRAPIRKTIYKKENKKRFSKNLQGLVSVNTNFKTGKIDLDKVGTGLAETIRGSILETIGNGLTPELSEPYRTKKVEAGYSELPLVKTRNLEEHILCQPGFKK